jgi:hypothetical protein
MLPGCTIGGLRFVTRPISRAGQAPALASHRIAPNRHHFSKVLDYKDYLLDPIATDELAQISDILLTHRKQGASMPEFAYDWKSF